MTHLENPSLAVLWLKLRNRAFASSLRWQHVDGGGGRFSAAAQLVRSTVLHGVSCLYGRGGQNRFGIPFWLVGEFATHF